jgi:putative N6-adenine-specific DNA methylase
MRRYFAPCTLGVEEALAGELRGLGAAAIAARPGGVACEGDLRLGYAANLWLRSAIRVQEWVVEGSVAGPEDLYELVASVDWERLLKVDQTLAVDASVRDSAITHSGFAALKTKDAIVDRFRRRFGRRPNVDVERPDLPLKLVLHRGKATLYRILSGESLHKRGWRPIQVRSPLNEATAAGLLLLSGWDRASSLVDPMCGSGTFVVEAALLAADVAPGLRRRFAFEGWPDYEPSLFEPLRREARARAKERLPFLLEGADRHAGALALARRGAEAAGVAGLVRFTDADLRTFVPAEPPKAVFVNPPYGERLGEGEDLVTSWRDLGAFLHERCRGADAYVLSGNPALTRHLGLRVERKWVVRNGPLDCRLLHYPIRD